MPKVLYKEILFDSEEEVDFFKWTEEAAEHGIIESCLYHPPSFVLSDQVWYMKDIAKKKPAKRELTRGHVVTDDFLIWTKNILPLNKLYQASGLIHIDTKGSHQAYGGAREFAINQKWVYHKFGIYIHKVIPDEFFKATWVPEYCRYTPVKGDVKKKYVGLRNVHDYLKIMGE